MNTKDARKAAGVMRVIIDAALAEIVKNNPEVVQSLKIKTIRFDSDGFRTTLECQWADGLSPEERAYDSVRELLDLPARGETFVSKGKAYTIFGMKPRGEKIIATDSKGARWLWKADVIKRLLVDNPHVGTIHIEI